MVRKESSGANERMKNAASFIAPFLLAWKSESFCLEDRLGTNGKETAADSAEKTAAFFVTGIWLTACSPYGVLVVLARAAQATAVIFGSALMFCAYKGQGLGFMIALMLVFSCLVCESGMRECLSFLPVPSLSWQSIEVFCACPEPVLANRRRFSCMKTQTHTQLPCMFSAGGKPGRDPSGDLCAALVASGCFMFTIGNQTKQASNWII
jgi:hypothetical protein